MASCPAANIIRQLADEKLQEKNALAYNFLALLGMHPKDIDFQEI